MRRPPARLRLGLAVALVVAVLVGVTYLIAAPGSKQMTIRAQFATAPGLYVGNRVAVLGMPVGHVTSIRPSPTYVTVTMSIPATMRIPADAKALLMAPNVVNDRYVQLTPVYETGPTMANNALIPTGRTAVPVSVDEIIGSLDQLATALGPSGANAHGALSDLLSNAARAFKGDGPALHSTLTSLGQAFGALSSQGPNLTALLDNVGNLTHVASQYTSTYQSFANNLAAVSTDLAGDNVSLANALSNLQQALGQLAAFIQSDGSALGGSVANLETFASSVAQKQSQLALVFSRLPTALQNLSAAFDSAAPGGPALRARFDKVGASGPFASSVCGSALLRLLLLVPAVAPTPDPTPSTDLACGVNGLLQTLPTPPGVSSGPNLTLGAFVGAGR